jgi:hypothetical protein
VLPAVAETVARALRLPFVAVRVENGAAAAHGDARTEQLMQIELLYRGEQVGELSAAPRDPGAGFSAADRRALETIGRQVAVAAHALRLTDDLSRDGALGVMGLLIGFNGCASAFSESESAPQAVATVAGLVLAGLGILISVLAARRLRSR